MDQREGMVPPTDPYHPFGAIVGQDLSVVGEESIN